MTEEYIRRIFLEKCNNRIEIYD